MSKNKALAALSAPMDLLMITITLKDTAASSLLYLKKFYFLYHIKKQTVAKTNNNCSPKLRKAARIITSAAVTHGVFFFLYIWTKREERDYR